ncbi:MAG: response regulator [Proteobacteria bacterium]|nr:response regulator [Pseudomonadota bacterium]
MQILVVDDELMCRNSLQAITKKLGCKVFAASDGAEAYAVWKREKPQIVISDWEMPRMDGLEFCTKIRFTENEDYTYFIIVTGKDDKLDIVAGMKAGADDYITKPYNKDELEFRIKAGERVVNLQSKELVIFALAKLAESRDEDTGGHLERVRFYSKILAETILDSPHPPPELNKQLINDIFLTSPLHDIGKVGIPDYILLKPDRLDDNEFSIMKSHTKIGHSTLNEVLQKVPRAAYLRIASEIACSHHEKYDGSGYPNKLAGDEIPLASRIFSLADVYDALVSKRPYKEPFSHDRAKAIIVAGKGGHFDPHVIEAFLASEQHFENIHHEFKD